MSSNVPPSFPLSIDHAVLQNEPKTQEVGTIPKIGPGFLSKSPGSLEPPKHLFPLHPKTS